MHDFELAQQRVQDEQSVHRYHVETDCFASAEVGEEQREEREEQDENQKQSAVGPHCAFANACQVVGRSQSLHGERQSNADKRVCKESGR